MNCKFDVAVVGAGPAGAWTAYSLARRGARVLLFDPSHPREKPCGGGITRRALQLVDDPVITSRLPAVSITSARFMTASSRRSADVSLVGDTLSVASRAEFDGRLFDAARESGVHVVAERVSDLRAVDGGFALDTHSGVHRARWLVGADGANSLVRRRLGTPFRRDQLSIATGFFAHGVTGDQIVIEFVASPPGYIWSFPRPDHLAIGICAQADAGVTAASLRRIAADWIGRSGIAKHAQLREYSWPIPSLHAIDFEQLSPGGSGWLLVGDAAGLVDPITREGIYFALLSAQWAADAIVSESTQAWQLYAARVRQEIGGELARAARLKRRFFRPHFTNLLVDALGRSASVRGVMADLVSGEQGYRTLKWRLLKTFQLGAAARLFLRHEAPEAGHDRVSEA